MNQPLVSVLIPCYNCEDFVEQAVLSIINQTYKNLEIICIDDGSTDNTAQILTQLALKDKRIKLFHNPENIKIIATLNKGLSLCSGKYIARMDADDISLANRIEMQVCFMEAHPECGVLGTRVRFFGNNLTWTEKLHTPKLPTKHNEIQASLYYGTTLYHPTVMIRSSVLKEYHLQYNADKAYVHLEDYKLWYDLSKVTQIRCLPNILLLYRRNENQISSKHTQSMILSTIAFRRNIISDFLAQYHLSSTPPHLPV